MISLALIKGVEAIAILVVLAVGAALLTWLERRMLGVWQDRYGPNRVGPFGLLQVVADMIKIFTKEDWIPPFADRFVFVVAPAVIMTTLLLAYAVVPVAPGFGVVDFNIGLLFFMAMSSLAVYSVMLGGWASNSKYSLLGGLRSSAQMISYEVFMGIALMGVVVNAGSFNLRDIVESQQAPVCFSDGFCIPGWYFISQALGMLVFLIAGIAETHRTPFDLPEAEHELAAGFHTEYSGMKFGMFFIGEYVGVILISSMLTTLYFGGWLGPTFGPAWLQAMQPMMWFGMKTFGFILFFILMRAALPRPRYDQLMAYGWKVMLPLALINLVITGGVVLARS